MMEVIMAWNTTSPFNSILYDSKFVSLLMQAVFDKKEVKEGTMGKKEKKFIQGMV